MEMSILITNEAKRELDKLLENSDKQCIRILTRGITMTSEAKIDLELDEPNANDNLYDVDGYKIIINNRSCVNKCVFWRFSCGLSGFLLVYV